VPSEARRRELLETEAALGASIKHVQTRLEHEAARESDAAMAVEGDAMAVEASRPEIQEESELERLLRQRQEVRRQLTADANYVEPVAWLRKRHPEVQYESRAMEETRFIDLALTVGAQYLYCHKGDCEHVLVVESVRAYHPSIGNYDSFPVLFYQNKVRRKKCFICKVRSQYIVLFLFLFLFFFSLVFPFIALFAHHKHLPGRIVTSDDNAVSENPCLFCEVCFEALHAEGEPQVSYKRHTYFVDL
jgi:hypothetical protein